MTLNFFAAPKYRGLPDFPREIDYSDTQLSEEEVLELMERDKEQRERAIKARKAALGVRELPDWVRLD